MNYGRQMAGRYKFDTKRVFALRNLGKILKKKEGKGKNFDNTENKIKVKDK